MAVGFVVALIVIIFHIRAIEKDNMDFPPLQRSDTVNGIIVRSKEYRGITYIETEPNYRFRVDNSKNYLNNPIRLSAFIQVGDSISKRRGVDTINIYRNGKEYYFVMGKIIGVQ